MKKHNKSIWNIAKMRLFQNLLRGIEVCKMNAILSLKTRGYPFFYRPFYDKIEKIKKVVKLWRKERKEKNKFVFHLVEWFKSLSKLTGLLIVAVASVLLAGTITWLSEHKSEPQEIHVTQDEFLKVLIPAAQQAYKDYGVLPSVSLAQAILESELGREFISK